MLRHILLVALVGATVATAQYVGLLAPAATWLQDTQMRWAARAPTGSVIVVDIDSKSIDAIGQWPWPRSVYGTLIDRLGALHADEIALDIDLSTPSSDEEDGALEEALVRAGNSVILAEFVQKPTAAADEDRISVNRPIARFASHVWPATVNVRQDSDGKVRRFAYADSIAGEAVPSIPAMFAGAVAPVGREYLIDFGISAGAIDRVSAIDVIDGSIAAERIAGKKVIVGAAAAELRDFFNVPVAGVVTGAALEAVATESLLQGRALAVSGPAVAWAGIILIACFVALGLRSTNWRRLVATLFVFALAVEAGAIAVQTTLPLVVNTAPWLTAMAAFAALVALREIDFRRILLAISRQELTNLRTILDQVVVDSPAGVLVIDEGGKILAASRAAGEILDAGTPVAGRAAATILPVALVSAISRAILRSKSGAIPDKGTREMGYRREDGGNRILEYTVAPSRLAGGIDESGKQRDDTFVACVTFVDVTAKRRTEHHLAYLARFDPRTGLANRNQFVERLEAAIATWHGGGYRCAVVCLDIDRFTSINDTLGHDFGDQLLQAVGGRIAEMLREGDLLARLGGDEFAALLVGADAEMRAEAIAEKAIRGVSQPYEIGGRRLIVGVSAGIATLGGRADHARAVLQRSDTALFRAKSQGGNAWASFTPKMLAGLHARQQLEVELWEAFDRDEFEIWYQPQVSLRDGQIVGAEALLRWPHAERGLISPEEFIPVACAVGLIRLLGERVLERACAEVAKWPVPVTLAVNLATVQITGGDLVEAVRRALNRSGLPARQLELEITESVFIHQSPTIDATMAEIREFGVHFSLDDFGTGYSSLAYLRKFPIEKIKIDRAFITGIPHDHESMSIVRAVAAIAQSLGIRLNAEGIENAEQVAFLRLIGCNEGQGYLYGKAVPAPEIVAMLDGLSEEARDRIA